MTTLTEAGRGSASLQVGEKLAISASVGTGRIVPFDAGLEPGTPIAFTGAALEIGPFDYIEQFTIECVSGTIIFDKVQTITDVRKRGSNATPRTGAARPSQSTTIELFTGGKLTVVSTNSNGLIVQLQNSADPGAVTFLNNQTVELGPFDDDRRYFLGCVAGEITYSQRLSVGVGGGGVVPVEPTLSGTVPTLTAGASGTFDLTVATGTAPFVLSELTLPAWLSASIISTNTLRFTYTNASLA